MTDSMLHTNNIKTEKPKPLLASSAEEIAATLLGLFDACRGNLRQIHLVGSASAAFVATLATWLFHLQVHVHGKSRPKLSGIEQIPVVVHFADLHGMATSFTSSTKLQYCRAQSISTRHCSQSEFCCPRPPFSSVTMTLPKGYTNRGSSRTN
jgi:hypothetical protein